MLKMNESPIKVSTPKEDSSSVQFLSGAVGTLKHPAERQSGRANNVKNTALVSSTSPAVNLGVAKSESLPSIKPPECTREHPKRTRTMKASCTCCHQLNDKPPKKIATTCYGKLDDDHEDLLNAALSVHSAREQACSDPFWKKMESVFAPVTPENLLLLKSVHHSTEELNQSHSQVVGDECHTLDVLKHNCCDGREESPFDQQSASSFEGLGTANMSSVVPPLFQRVLSALIVEDEDKDLYNPDEGGSVPCHPMSMPSPSSIGASSSTNGKQSLSSSLLDDRVLQELHSIGVFPETMTRSDGEEESIDREIKELQKKQYQQAEKAKKHLEKIDKTIQSVHDSEKRNTEEFALDQLTIMAYKKTMGGMRRKNTISAGPKLRKKAASALIQRTLSRCKEFEDTGSSCFSQPEMQQILFSATPPGKDAKPIQCDGSMIGSSTCSEMQSKVASRGSGSIEGLNNRCEKFHLGVSGSQQALADSSKGKKIMTVRSQRRKDEGVTRDREPKRKMVARNPTSVTSNLLVNSLGTDNVSKAASEEKLSSARPTADKPGDPIVNFNNKLKKVECASPANVSENVAKEAGSGFDCEGLDVALNDLHDVPVFVSDLPL